MIFSHTVDWGQKVPKVGLCSDPTNSGLLATGAAVGPEAMAPQPAAWQSLPEAWAQGAHLAASSAAAHADEERPRLGTIGLGRGALGAAASRRSHLRSGGHTFTASARSRRDVGADAVRIASGAVRACAQEARRSRPCP